LLNNLLGAIRQLKGWWLICDRRFTSSLPNDYNLKDKQNFSRYYPRRLSAEALYDGFHQVTATTQAYGGLPAGTRALQLPETSNAPYFLKVFGQPQGDTACECERSQEANLAQSLHLLNSSEVQDKIANASGRAVTMSAEKDRPHDARIRELYRWVYAREPNEDELKIALAHIGRHEASPKIAYEDILWALVNTKEFLFNTNRASDSPPLAVSRLFLLPKNLPGFWVHYTLTQRYSSSYSLGLERSREPVKTPGIFSGSRALHASRACLIAATLCFLSNSTAQAQLPQTRLYSVFPPGAKAGASVELTLAGGVDLDEVNRLLFDHPGITAVPKMQGDQPY
jgi:hypothetical protein